MILNPNKLKIEYHEQDMLRMMILAFKGKATRQQPDAEENIFALPNRRRGYVVFIGDLNK